MNLKDKDRYNPKLEQAEIDCIFEAMVELKSRDIIGLDVSDLTSLCSGIFIASGSSPRHVSSIADNIVEYTKKTLSKDPISKSGTESNEWVVLDYGDFIIHLFHEPKRQYFNIEELLKDAKPLKTNDLLYESISKLTTGMYVGKLKSSNG